MGCLGLIVGSFLNVVVHRLPIMMNTAWHAECHEFLELPQPERKNPTFNLMFPGSHCPNCNVAIKAYQNIPVISFLLLRGRCVHCQVKISYRYPIVEFVTGFISVIIALQFGFSSETLFALFLSWSLIALSLIDFDHQLLPDSITLPLLWLGLLISLGEMFSDTQSSLIGAVAGYLSLWTVYQVFKLCTGKEGMGFGDFKLLAMLGAWLGWQMVPVIVLLSSLVGAVVGISMILFFKRDRTIPIPFGPYLAGAGWLALLWGEDIIRYYLNYVGLA